MNRFFSALIILFSLAGPLVADEIRPGYLEITEESDQLFAVLWKVPQDQYDRTIRLHLPASCVERSKPTLRPVAGATIQRWYSYCEGGLKGKTISATGLNVTNTDILVQLQWLDESTSTTRLIPASPSHVIPQAATRLKVAGTYFLFGIEHILEGLDHLFFVLALLIIVRSIRLLVLTITAFTLAHSVTLALATLDILSVPQQPVEAVIALSIVFLACEIQTSSTAKPRTAELHMVETRPWLVAASFGLLHGLGFANALQAVGLPDNAIPTALVFFNLGVEAGQLVFIGFILLMTYLVKRLLSQQYLEWGKTTLVYGIGGIASFWIFERISAF